MSETPRDQRDLWHEVSRTFEELGEALRVHLSPDAARSPSDPTTSSARQAHPGDTERAPWADPAHPGQAEDFGDPWAAATDRPGRATAADATSATDPTTTGPADSGRTTSGPAETGTTAAGGSPTETTAGASGTDAPGPAGTARGATETGPTSAPGTAGTGTAGTGPAGTGTAGTGPAGTGTAGTGTAGTGPAGTGTAGEGPADTGRAGTGAGSTAGTGASGTGASGTGASGTGASGTGTGDGGASGAGRGRGWREWSGTADGGRFGGADWESARESVRDIGSSVRRIATQAGDAARDPHVRDSAQRAARSLGDAIVTTVEDFAAELRGRMRNPRWSDTSQPPEPPPVAPIEDKRDDKP